MRTKRLTPTSFQRLSQPVWLVCSLILLGLLNVGRFRVTAQQNDGNDRQRHPHGERHAGGDPSSEATGGLGDILLLDLDHRNNFPWPPKGYH